MRLRARWTSVAVAVAATVIAGCGSSSSHSKTTSKATTSTPATTTATTAQAAGKPVMGGTLTVLDTAGSVDSLDPGYWYYQTDYEELMQTTTRQLYTFTPQGTTPVPDLATALPVASNGGKTLTIHLRPGIHYSPPLASKTVTSMDIKYAMERCFLENVGSDNYVASYYNQIVGVPKGGAHVAKLPNITGLQTPNPLTLVINTTAPVGVLANANALALPCTTPVPQYYAAKFDKGATSSYGMHQVFVGPYMIKGAGTGTVPGSSYSPGKTLLLVRNPSWSRATDPIRGAYVDAINIEGGFDPNVSAREILTGSDMMSGDSAAPPVAILQQGLTSGEKSQFSIGPSDGNRYISLNTTIPPLNNVWVRRAISAVINRDALRLTRGGATLGTIATHFIPPGMPGFAQAGGDGSSFPWTASPTGNVALAKSYMVKAGYKSGMYTGPAILTIADNEPPASNTALAIQQELSQIGLKLNMRQVPHATMLSKFCEITAAKVGICPNLGWGKDFYDSQSMIDPVFSAAALGPATTNMAQVNNPALTSQINKAVAITDPTQRAAAWGALDKEVTSEAYVATWLWDNDIVYGSKNVHRVTWAFNGNAPDYVDSWLTNG
jgi:peptide/nickel transport system substrate-binding protein